MRKISIPQILFFFSQFSFILLTSTFFANYITHLTNFANLQPLLGLFLLLLFYQFFGLVFYRLNLLWHPIPIGEIPPHSKAEHSYHLHLLYHILFFHPIMRSHILPVPIMKLYYICLGVKIGANSFSSGVIFDSLFVKIGHNTLIGHQAALIPHAIEGEFLAHYPITLGDHVTIGTGAKILGGVIIDDYAIVSANAVVIKGTHIQKGEIWGGVPAKLISKRQDLGPDLSSIARNAI